MLGGQQEQKQEIMKTQTFASRITNGESSLLIKLRKRNFEQDDFEVKKPTKRTFYERPSIQDLTTNANSTELLIPIKIQLELDHFLYNDCFLWNLNEKTLTLDQFAKIICADLELNYMYVSQIIDLIKPQINDAYQFYMNDDSPLFPDSRITISINVVSNSINFKDKFEWEVNSLITPVEFANQLCRDLNLGGEFPLLIAFQIHNQLLRSRLDDEVEICNAVEFGVRDVDDWGPQLNFGGDFEGDKIDHERNARRMRRESKNWSKKDRRTSLLQKSDESCSFCWSWTNVKDGFCQCCSSFKVLGESLPEHRRELFKYV